MTFVLTIDCDNAAFEDDDLEHELARILSVAANKVLQGHREFNLRDVNGNTVGAGRFEEER